ncbi:MAG: YeeE/YedE family protein [Sneathiella sp.]
MTDFSVPVLMALLGLLGGGVMGYTARTARFCTFGAIEDARICGDFRRLRSWALAVVVAIITTWSLDFAGLIDIRQAIHLRPELTWLSLIIGGLVFGFGMAQVGTCPFGALVRAGTGDMRALVVLIVIGIIGYMTMRGITALARVAFLDSVHHDFDARGLQSIPALLGITGETGLFIAALIIAALLLGWVVKSPEFRASRRAILAGLIIGFCVAGGWFATGYLGNDEFDPQAVLSFSYISSVANSLIYLMTYSGATISFAVGATGGVLLGSCLASLIKQEFKLEAFDDGREMRRYLIGAALMGFGGITALGCTVGQGITGLSTLSIGSVIATASIGIGAVFGLHYLLEDDLKEAVSAFFRT